MIFLELSKHRSEDAVSENTEERKMCSSACDQWESMDFYFSRPSMFPWSIGFGWLFVKIDFSKGDKRIWVKIIL